MQSELSCLGEFPETCAEREQTVAGYGGGEVGERFADVVDAVFLHAEDVAVGGFGVRSGDGVGEEVVEGFAGVVCKFFEEGLRFGVC